MKRQRVQDAYKRIQPSEAERNEMLQNILSAASALPPAERNRPMKRRKKKPLMIAAIVALMVLLLGCAWVALNLGNLKIGEYSYTEPRHFDENGEKVYETEKTKDVLSLQGIAGSPEYMAAQEWYSFEQSYDSFSKLLNEADANPIDVPAEYDAYFVYTQEMIDKVDEIAEKYNLELAGPIAMAEEFQMDIFFDALGIEGLHQKNAQAIVEYLDAYFYSCGNFKTEFCVTLTGDEAEWKHEILASMRYCGKGYLDTVFVYISNIDDYEQWTYTMADGNEVLIIMGDDAARIFYDGEAAFVSAGFRTTYEDENGNISRMTKRDVELTADSLTFTVKPKKPDMEETAKKLETAYQEYLAEQEAQKETWVNPFAHDYSSYAEVAAYILENSSAPEKTYYALWDVNGDGTTEMLMGSQYSFGSVKTVKDGKVITLISNGTDAGYSLCENGVILYQNGDSYWFNELNEDGYTSIDCVEYDPWEETWSRTQNGVTESISEKEAMAILEGYCPFNPEMTPITEFPMDE